MAPSPLNHWARSSCHRSAAPRGRGKPATSAEILGWYNWGSIRKTLMKFDDWWYFKRRVFVAIPTMLGNGSISCCMLGDHIAYQGRVVTCVGGPVNESKNIWELTMYFSGDDWSYESGRLLVLLHGNIVKNISLSIQKRRNEEFHHHQDAVWKTGGLTRSSRCGNGMGSWKQRLSVRLLSKVAHKSLGSLKRMVYFS